MAVPPNPDLPRIVSTPDFAGLVDRVKRELQVSISPNFKGLMPYASNGNAASEGATDYSFKFRCQRSNSDFLITAREMLEQFLLNHNIHVYPSPTSHTHKRGDSFAEAFPHFDSKVLSAARTRGHGEPPNLPDSGSWLIRCTLTESMDLSLARSDVIGDRRLRMANSSPDVKALFNSPAYIYNLTQGDQEDPDTNFIPNSAESEVDHWTPLPPIVSLRLVVILKFVLTIGIRGLAFTAQGIAKMP